MTQKYEKEINGKKIALEIFQHEPWGSPRDWDNLGHMVCWHRRYSLGDPHDIDHNDFGSWEEIEEYLAKKMDACVILPIYMYDHGGITISTKYVYPYTDRWDAGQIGFIYCTREKIRKYFSVKYVTEKWKKRARGVLMDEVDIYDCYLRGEVYGFRLFENGEEIDSCYEFYGDDIRSNGLLDHLPEEYRKLYEEVN